MFRLPLTNSTLHALVDDDFAHLAGLGWQITNHGYIVRREDTRVDGKRRKVTTQLARLILLPGSRQLVRFRDGNPRNCQRANMYLVGKDD